MAVNVASGSDDHYSGPSTTKKPVSIDIETIRLHLSSFVGRVKSRVSLDTLRPLPMFLGLGSGFCLSAGAFTPPVSKVDKTTLEKIRSRVKLNFAFFLTNYVLVAAMTALVVALMHPGMILFVGIVYGLWSLHSFMIRHELVLFGIQVHALLSIQQRFYLLFVISTIVVIWKCLVPAIIFVAISSLIILTHAFLRDPKHIETTSDLLGAEDSDDEEAGGESNGSTSGSEILVEQPRGDVI